MAANPRIRRLTLVPSGGNDELRRYRLARLDEIALATPPDRTMTDGHRPAVSANGAEPARATPPDVRARPA